MNTLDAGVSLNKNNAGYFLERKLNMMFDWQSGKSYRQIGLDYGLSAGRVMQIIHRVLRMEFRMVLVEDRYCGYLVNLDDRKELWVAYYKKLNVPFPLTGDYEKYIRRDYTFNYRGTLRYSKYCELIK